MDAWHAPMTSFLVLPGLLMVNTSDVVPPTELPTSVTWSMPSASSSASAILACTECTGSWYSTGPVPPKLARSMTMHR